MPDAIPLRPFQRRSYPMLEQIRYPSRRFLLGAALLVAAFFVVALPLTGYASSKVVNTYNVKVEKGILASGDTVKAKATITNGAAQQADWWSSKTISAVVRTGVDRGFAKAYNTQGYRCTASAQAWVGTFSCTLTGADVPTTIHLTFQAIWRH
jgi:hypothetical protein